MKFPRWLSKPDWFMIIIGLFVVFSLLLPVVIFTNPFSTTITVKEKNNYSAGRYMKNIVIDTTGKIYTVDNMYLVVNYDAISKFSALEVGKTYRVSGYGISIPFLQMFPNITQISPA